MGLQFDKKNKIKSLKNSTIPCKSLVGLPLYPEESLRPEALLSFPPLVPLFWNKYQLYWHLNLPIFLQPASKGRLLLRGDSSLENAYHYCKLSFHQRIYPCFAVTTLILLYFLIRTEIPPKSIHLVMWSEWTGIPHLRNSYAYLWPVDGNIGTTNFLWVEIQ